MSSAFRVAAFYAALTIGMSWPLAVQIASAMPVGVDNQHLAWLLSWIAHAAANEPGRVLDGNIFYPSRHAVAFSDPNLSNALLLSPLFFATRDPAMLVNSLFLGSFVLCGLAAYALALRFDTSHRAAIAAGLFFAFSPLRFSHLDHVQLYAFWWTPVAVVAFDRYLCEGHRIQAWITMLLVVLQIHASFYLAAFQVTALVLLLMMSAATGRRKVAWRRIGVDLGLASAVGLLLCLPLGLAYYSVSRTWGVTRSLDQNLRYAASITAFLSPAPNNVVWGSLLGRFADPVAPWEKYLFPGVVPVLLAMIGIAREPRALSVRYGTLLFIVGAIFSLGPMWSSSGEFVGSRLPYYFAYQWILPLRALRAPARWALMASLGLALVASAGAGRLPRAAWALALLLAVGEAWVWPMSTQAAPSISDPPLVYRFLAQSGTEPVIELPLGDEGDELSRVETARMYWSTLHWRPLANGYSGFSPATYRTLARLSSDPSPGLLRFLAAWNIRCVVLHLDELSSGPREKWERMIGSPGVREVFRDGHTRVLELAVAAEPFRRVRLMLAEVVNVTAGLRQRLDGTLAAADQPVPVPPPEIGWHTGQVLWTSIAGKVTSTWARYYCPPALDNRTPDGLLFVAAPSEAGAYRLDLAGACFDLSAPVTVQHR